MSYHSQVPGQRFRNEYFACCFSRNTGTKIYELVNKQQLKLSKTSDTQENIILWGPFLCLKENHKLIVIKHGSKIERTLHQPFGVIRSFWFIHCVLFGVGILGVLDKDLKFKLYHPEPWNKEHWAPERMIELLPYAPSSLREGQFVIFSPIGRLGLHVRAHPGDDGLYLNVK